MINTDLIVEQQLEISATPDSVWKAIVTPGIVEKYFFGTTVQSDWTVGSPIIFSGDWEGKTFEDKGTILEILPRTRLLYNYWSSFSGLEDIPENYSLVTYTLEPTSEGTLLKIRQQGFVGTEARDHAKNGWHQVLSGMKQLIEHGML